MRAPTMAMGAVAIGFSLWGSLCLAGSDAPVGAKRPSATAVALGKQLFHRKFIPNDPRCHGGDGVGPVYNDVSCVGCHSMGGSGGAGSNKHNVQMLTPRVIQANACRPNSNDTDNSGLPTLAELVETETGLRGGGSVVLHRSGSHPEYGDWRKWLLGKSFEKFTFVHSERNTPALFGAGLIDAIPNEAIIDNSKRLHRQFPEIKGRLCRLNDGRIGRFGWKAQMASLDDFVLTACSVELGLEVPGHHQSRDPNASSADEAELDLTMGECLSLIAYVRDLPAPSMSLPKGVATSERVLKGGAVFKSIGCASCHTPTLGGVEGLYSDLLVHDMGPDNADSGGYGSMSPGDDLSDQILVSDEASRKPGLVGPMPMRLVGAQRPEWRTPPLWGLRDSAPYLHNGQAKTVEAAILRHGGEGAESAKRFRSLPGAQQMELRAFLMSLVAPAPTPSK